MTSTPVIDAADAPVPLRLLDVRDRDGFLSGHAPEAVRVPIEDWIAAARTPDADFGNTHFWADKFSALGIGSSIVPGIYDDGRMTEASRVWFILQYFGIDAVILNGGWPAVRDAGLVGAAADRVAPNLCPGAGSVGLVSRQDLKDGPEARAIWDARTAAEFRGEDLKANRRGGHLPGAILLPHAELLEGTRLRAPADLRVRFEAAGLATGRLITTHCDGGGRAALAAVAAIHAGFDPVSVYYLSFSDWATDDSCPIVAPDGT